MSLLDFMHQNGLPCPHEPILDGTVRRYSSRPERPDKEDEWYIGGVNGENVTCTFASWRTDQKFTYYSGMKPEFDPKLKEMWEENLKKIQEEESKNYEEGAKNAKEIWEKSEIATHHPYLQKKKISPPLIKISKGRLVLPIYEEGLNLASLQFIDADGKKKFLKRGKAKNGYFLLGDAKKARKIYVAEGFATGFSVHYCSGEVVAVAYSSGNCCNTGIILKNRYPEAEIILAADLGQAGEKAAQEWKDFKIGKVCFPQPKEGSSAKDFNDIHQELGKEETAKQLVIDNYYAPTVQELFTRDIKQIEWVVEGLFPKGSINMIYGDAGAGKSFFTMELCFCICCGIRCMKWLTKQNSICYLDGEMMDAEIKERMTDIMNRRAGEFEDIIPKEFRILSGEEVDRQNLLPLDLCSKDCQKSIEPMFEKSDVIVIDNLSTLIESIEDEDKAKAWLPFIKWLVKWKKKGKTFILVHHSNKSTGTARGSSRLNVELDTILKLCKASKPNYDYPVMFEGHIEKGRKLKGKGAKKPFYAYINPDKKDYASWTFRDL